MGIDFEKYVIISNFTDSEDPWGKWDKFTAKIEGLNDV